MNSLNTRLEIAYPSEFLRGTVLNECRIGSGHSMFIRIFISQVVQEVSDGSDLVQRHPRRMEPEKHVVKIIKPASFGGDRLP